jgi:hypothetical protein
MKEKTALRGAFCSCRFLLKFRDSLKVTKNAEQVNRKLPETKLLFSKFSLLKKGLQKVMKHFFYFFLGISLCWNCSSSTAVLSEENPIFSSQEESRALCLSYAPYYTALTFGLCPLCQGKKCDICNNKGELKAFFNWGTGQGSVESLAWCAGLKHSSQLKAYQKAKDLLEQQTLKFWKTFFLDEDHLLSHAEADDLYQRFFAQGEQVQEWTKKHLETKQSFCQLTLSFSFYGAQGLMPHFYQKYSQNYQRQGEWIEGKESLQHLQQYRYLVLHSTQTQTTPALFPKIRTVGGQILYDIGVGSSEGLPKSGKFFYVSQTSSMLDQEERKSPSFVEGQSLPMPSSTEVLHLRVAPQSKGYQVDLVISEESATVLKENPELLRQHPILIVLE